jgi:hypothetical protein
MFPGSLFAEHRYQSGGLGAKALAWYAKIEV